MLALENLSIRYRGPALLDGVSARINPGDRIGLLGRNGAGKTTLMKIIAGDVTVDDGSMTFNPGITVGRLDQEVPPPVDTPVRRWLIERMSGTADPGHQSATDSMSTDHEWDEDAWQIEQTVDQTLSRMELDPDANFGSLSSGMKRRVMLAHAIAAGPDLLLLDEPTNHLDIPSIVWLENFLASWRGTLLFVTHDRAFLQSLANRIWEIDRGRLFDWTCDYPTFLKRRADALAAEEKQNALFDKRLAEEERWIRQGIKARRTRNEGRVRALQELRRVRASRVDKVGKSKLNFETEAPSGQRVVKLENVSFGYDDQVIMRNFDAEVFRGDRIGIIGPNGAGKSTLLKLLLGQLKPDSGEILRGTNLQIAYFDQLRDTLDGEQTVADNVGEGSDRVEVGGVNKHIYGYLQDFLFTPERARSQVKFLSGGERNRVLLAKLMTRPANVIVLDEPTNDLDAETLELLEEQLTAYDGTLLIVSHDRAFLNNVVTETWVFEEDGINAYVGGYDDWRRTIERRDSVERPNSVERPSSTERRGSSDKKANASPSDSAGQTDATPTPTTNSNAKKLSYKDRRELDGLPERIETLESAIATLHETMAQPDYYTRPPSDLKRDAAQLAQTESDLTAAYARWEELESMS